MRVMRPRKCSPSTTTATIPRSKSGRRRLRRGIWRNGFELAGHGLLDGQLEIERALRERHKQVELVEEAHAAVAFEHGNLGNVVKLHAAVRRLQRVAPSRRSRRRPRRSGAQ